MFQIVKRFFTNILSGRATHKLAKRHRSPTNFQECVDRPERERSCWKPVLFISIVIVSFYFVLHSQATKSYVANKLRRFTNVSKSDAPDDLNAKEIKSVLDPDEEIIQIVQDGSTKIKYRSKVKVTENLKESSLPPCNVTVTKIVTVHKEVKKSINLDRLYLTVGMGGHYKPKGCRPKYKVAIFVPYRNRSEHLRALLYNIHPFLMHQQLEYRIFVFEQSGKAPFNKGRLFNAGFLEVQKNSAWQWECIIFHDVDLLPADGRIPYTCPTKPRQMCSMVLPKSENPSYRIVFGGVTAMTISQFRQVNGYSNLYWGWGGEDNDMDKRIQAAGMTIVVYKDTLGRYESLKHESRLKNPWRYRLLRKTKGRYKYDGLNTLHYRMLSYALRPLYTHILIDISPPQQPDFVTETYTTYLF